MNDVMASPRQLIQLLAAGGLRSVSQLAREARTSESLVRAMLEDLLRHDYLSTLTTGCDSQGCPGCSISSFCVHSADGREAPLVYSLTAKGWELASRSSSLAGER